MHVEEYKLQRKELELKALLEITQAINENQSEEVLVNIFKFTCLARSCSTAVKNMPHNPVVMSSNLNGTEAALNVGA